MRGENLKKSGESDNFISKDVSEGTLASQNIRALIKQGKIITKYVEDKIQPSSFEPVISDELFVIDTEASVFRPRADEEVYTTLMKLPERRRKHYDIKDGFELRRGFTYLIPLREKIGFLPDSFIRSSPKSSFGRLFFNTRLMADYNASFDEIRTIKNKEIKLWLLVQPQVFNSIIYPGMSLNQLRFFNMGDGRLNTYEIKKEFDKSPILYAKEKAGLSPIKNPEITDGLHVHLNLSGDDTDGVIGLRARNNWEPIDLKKGRYYNVYDFFEPIKAGKEIKLEPGQFYLFSSKEVFKVPRHLSCEVRSHSGLGFMGTLHFAGFIDNGFYGDLVLEVISNESSTMMLEDGMPISKIDLFKTIELPDKVYSKKIGSHYQGQFGPRPSKFFKRPNFIKSSREFY